MNFNRHMKETGKLAKDFADFLNLDKKTTENLYVAAIIHDKGKSMINQKVLNKKSKLSKEEFEEIKKHPIYSRKILFRKKIDPEIVLATFQHHERIDGNGYPMGLKNHEISFTAKILSICDAFEAMVGERPYRKSLSIEEALLEIKKNLGSQFDYNLGNEFINFIKNNPW